MIVRSSPAMNTVFRVSLPDRAPTAWRLAADEALLEAHRLDRLLSRFNPRSDIARLAAAAGRSLVRVEPETFALLTEIVRLAALTAGAFDPTLGPLMDLWRGRTSPPADDELAAARSVVGIGGLQLEADLGQAGLLVPGMGLDLGGVGKGYAVDRITAALIELGVEEALVDGGTSSAKALGRLPAALAEPGQTAAPFAVVTLDHQAAACSGVRGAGFEFEGRFLGHILDPRTGWPTQGPRVAAAIHESATVAEVLSTALLVGGTELLADLPRAFPTAAALLLGDAADVPATTANWPG